MGLCLLCSSVSLSEMRGPNSDRMQPHQSSYLALKQSADAGCHLCGFFWGALERGTDNDRNRDIHRAALAHVCEQYPGCQISLVAWGGAAATLDRVYIITTGEIPDDNDDEDAPADPTVRPDHQLALNGVVDLYADPGKGQLFSVFEDRSSSKTT